MAAPRKYTDGHRDRAVRLVAQLCREDAGLSTFKAIAEVGARLKIPVGTLRTWVQQEAPATPGEAPALVESARSGQRLTALCALRDVIAEALAKTDSARDVASLSKQFMDVLAQIEAVEKTAPEAKGTPLDELEKRRAARQSGPSGRARAEGGVVAR